MVKTIEINFKQQEDYDDFHKEIVDWLRMREGIDIIKSKSILKINIDKMPK